MFTAIMTIAVLAGGLAIGRFVANVLVTLVYGDDDDGLFGEDSDE